MFPKLLRRPRAHAHAVLISLKTPLLGLLVILGGFLVILNQGPTSKVNAAASNGNINFQMRLLTSTGTVVPDGNYNLEFKVFDQANSTGSSQGSCSGDTRCLWVETRTGGNVVRVVNGYFSVSLGSVTAFGSTIKWDQPMWLGVRIGATGSPSWEAIELTSDGTATGNKIALTAVPYAFRASVLASSTAGNTGTLSFGSLTNNPVLTLPNETGTVCTTAVSGACSALSFYIQNQNSGQQSSSNFWISGTGRADTSLLSPAVDATGASGTIALGNTNATTINIGGASGASTTIGGGNVAHTVHIADAGTSTTQNITIGSAGTNNGNLLLQIGTGTLQLQGQAGSSIGIANNSANQSIQIGNVSSSTDVTIDCGTGNCKFGAGATDHSTTVGSTTGTSLTTINGGSGGISLGANTVVAANKNLTFASGNGNFDASASSGTFDTTTGNNTLRGNTSVSSTKSFTVTAGATSLTGLAAGSSTALTVVSGAASNVGTTIQGAASQTANLLQLQNSAGANLHYFDASGNNEQLGYTNTPFGGLGNYGNLLTRSEDFATTWTATNITVTVNDGASNPAPDSNTTADKLVSTAGSATIKQSVSGGNLTYTFSVWLKTNAATQPIQLRIDSNGTPATGTAASFTANTTWQRFSVTQTFSSGVSTITPTIIITNNSATVVAWGAQMVQASNPQVYVRTISAAVTASDGLINNGNAIFIPSTDSTAALQIQNAAGSSYITADSTNRQLILGKTGASGIDGKIVFNNATNSNTAAIVSGVTSGSYTLTLPTALPGSTQCLQGDNAGTLSFATCATGTFLAKNATDTSSAAAGAGYLYTFTNSSSVSTGGVLSLDNNTNTGNTLSATTAANPASGKAVLYAQNTNGSPSGNLLDLQSGSSPTSKFSVDASGNVLALGTYNTNAFTSSSLQFGAASTATVQSAASRALTITGHATSTWSLDAGNLTLQTTAGASSLILDAGTAGSGTVTIGNSTANIISIGTNNAAHTIGIGNTGATGTQAITIGGSGNTANTVAIEAGTGAGSIAIGNGTSAHNIAIGNGGVSAQVIAIGSTSGASALTERVGTGNYSLDGVAGSTYTLGASTTTGTFTLGGTAQTGNITLGQYNGAATSIVNIGNNAGATSTQQVNIGTSVTAGAINTISIGSSTSSSAVTLTAGSGNINLNATTIDTNATTLGLFNANAATVTLLQAATSLSLGATTGTLSIRNANTTIGNAAGSGVLTNNGSTLNTTLAVLNDSDGGALGGTPGSPLTAAQSVDIYTSISVNQTTASQTITLPTPTANTTYGRLLYLSNIGTASFTLGGATISPGTTATLVWSNTNGGASWQFAGADANGILNQNSSAQTAVFWINGSGRSDTSFIAPALERGTVGTLSVGTTSNTTAITIGSTNITGALTLESGSSGSIAIGNSTTAHAINIGNGGTSAQVIAIGSTSGASALTERVGTGNYSLDGVAGSTYTLGASTTTGTFTLGGTAQTGNIVLGSSSGSNSVLIGNGAGATTVNISNANTGGAVNIGAAYTTGTITIGGTGAQTGTISIGTGTGAQALNFGTGGTGAKTVTIGSQASTSSTTIDSGTGAINIGNSASARSISIGNVAAIQAITVGSTNSTSSLLLQGGTGNVQIQSQGGTLGFGNNAVAQSLVIGNTTGATGITERVGTGNYSLDGVTNSTYTFGASTTTGTITLGGTAQTGTITIGQATGANSNTVTIGSSIGASGTQTINIGTSATASSTTNVVIGSTIAGTTTVQSAGGLVLSSLGTTNNASYLCRNGSNILAACNTTGAGAAFVQGGNSFGAVATLGTNDTNGLDIRTNSTTRAGFDQSNNLFLGNAGSGGTNAAPSNFVVAGSGSSTAATAGGNLTLQGGAGASTTTGSNGGTLTLQGGTAAGGSLARTGGAVALQGGTPSATGVGGDVTLTSGAGGGTSGNSGAITLLTGNTTSGTAGNISIDVGTSSASNGSILIGTASRTQTITIGNSTGGAIRVGQNGGTLQLDGTNFDVSTAGVITLAGSQAPDITTAGAATSTNITIQPGTSTAATGTGASTTIKAGDQSGATTSTGGALTLQGGSATAGGGTRTGGDVSIQVGTGATANGNLNLGSAAQATTITIGNVTGATALTERVGTGNYSLDGVAGSTYTLGASTTTGTFTLGGTAQTGTITIGQYNNTSTSTINIGAALASAGTQAINIGTGTTGTGTIIIGNTGGGSTTIQGPTTNINSATIATNATTLGLFNTNAATVTLLQAATSLSVGATTGTLSIRNANTTIGNAAGSGTLTNNGATLNFTLALGNLSAGSIGAANATVDIYTSFSIAPTAAGRTYTIPTPTANTAYGRIIYISNIAAAGNTFIIGTATINPGSTASLIWSNSNGADSWQFAGADAGNLQGSYNNSTGGATPEIKLDATRTGIDIQDSDTTIGLGNNLFNLRAANASGLGSILYGVDTLGNTEQLGNADTPFGGLGTYSNLLVRSEDFLTTWVTAGTTTGTTANDGASNPAPDSTTTADKLVSASSGASFCQFSGTGAASTTSTFSVWLKTNSSTQAVDLRIDGGPTSCATGATVTGTVKTVTATTTWQRFFVTQAIGTCASCNIKTFIFPGGTGGTGTAVAWGAQLNIGSSPQVYVRRLSTNVAATDGFVSNGTAIFQNSANSTVAFQIQNASDVNVFSTDTTNGQIVLGQANGGGLTGKLKFNFSGSSGSTTLTLADPSSNNFTLTIPTLSASATICTTDAVCGIAGGTNNYLSQVPSSNSANAAGANVISPTASGITGLTVNGTTNGTTATALIVNQAAIASDALVVNSTGTSSTQTNGIAFNRSGAGGTTTNGLAINNSNGTTTNGIAIAQSGGTLSNGLVFSGTIGTDILGSSKAVNITAQGTSIWQATTGDLTVKATAGASNLVLDAGTAGSGTVTIGNSTANTISIGTNNAAHTIGIGNTGATGVQLITIGGAGNTGNTVTIDAGTGVGSISIGNTTSAHNIKIGNGGTAAQVISIGSNSGASALTEQVGTGNYSLDGVTASTYTLGASTTTGTYTLGGASQTGAITIGQYNNTSSSTISIGSALASAGTQVVDIGRGTTGTGNITIGNTAAGFTTIQSPTTNINSATIATNATTLGLFNTNAATVTLLQAATSLSVGATTGTVTFRNANQTFGNAAGSGVLTNNGSTLNTTLAVLNDSDGGALGGTPGSPLTAAQSVDIYTSISVFQTTAAQTITLATPTANTTYGRLLYLSNIGTASFTLGGATISPGTTATLVWSNTNGGASWQFAGADANGILNQNTVNQTADFRISGTGRANTSFISPLFDALSGGALSVGTSSATGITIGSTTNTSSILLQGSAGATITLGNAAGFGQFKNNGSTLNSTLALGNLSAGSIGSAATTVDIYTSFSIAPTATNRTYTIPTPTANTAYGRIIYISNIAAAGNTFNIGTATINPGATASLIWSNSNGADSWQFAGADAGNLQGSYNNSTGSTTPEIKLDSTRLGLDIQDADTTIGAGNNLVNIRASNSAGLGSIISSVDTFGDTEQLGYHNTPSGGLGAYSNLLTRSEQFDQVASAPWTNSSVTTPTANTIAAPDSNTTAESLADSGAGGSVCQFSGTAAANTTFTFSVWLKTASGTASPQLRIDGGPTSCATAATVTGTTATLSATTTWQRFFVTQAIGTCVSCNAKVFLLPAGAGSGTIHAWGAQLVVGSVPQVYVRTVSTTVAATTGLVNNGSAIFQNVANSASAFQVQNASGSNLFSIDTTNSVVTIGGSAGFGQLTNNGSTLNGTLAVANDSDGGALGGTPSSPLTAAQSVDIYTSISVNQTTASQTITLPTPTANTTYGRLLYLSNIGSVSFKISTANISPGATATLVWSNTNGGASWQFAGSDASNLQGSYNNSTGGTTSEIILDSTRAALDIQDRSTSNGGTLAVNLFNVRATSANDTTLGSILLGVGNTGALTFQNSADNAAAVAIKNAAGSTVLNLDNTKANANNLVANPSFETAVSNWSAINGGTAGVQDATQFYEGTKSLKIVTNTTAGGGGSSYSTGAGFLVNGTTYTLSAYVKTDSNLPVSTFEMGHADNGSAPTNVSCLTAQILDKDWQRFTCTWTSGAITGSPYVYFKVTDNVSRNLFVDDVLLQTDANSDTNYRNAAISMTGTIINSPVVLQNTNNSTTAFVVQNSAGATVLGVDTTNDNLISNPDFEANATGWSAALGTTTVRRESTPTQVYNGNYSLKVTTSATALSGAQFALNPVVTSASTTYTVSFFAKLDSGSAAFTDLNVRFSPDGTATSDCSITAINSAAVSTTGFQRYFCAVSSATAPTTSGFIRIMQTAAAAHTFYIDSVQLEQTTVANMTNYSLASIQLSGTIQSPVIFKGTSNSTKAFQIQDTAGASVFSVDTTADTVSIASGVNNFSGLKFANLTSANTGAVGYTGILGLDVNGNVGLSQASVSLTSPALAYWDGCNNPTTGSQSYPLATLSGNASYTGGGVCNSTSGVQLTPATNSNSGSINWSFTQVPFEETQFKFKAGGGTGADSTWFYSYSSAVPTSEFGCTSVTTSPCGTTLASGYVIYFSEWHGCVGIVYGSYTDGNQCGSGGGANPLTSAHLANIGDNQFHDVDIQLLYNQIIVRWDGIIVLTYTDSYGRDTSNLNFGFGARTGGSNNVHDISGLLVTKLGTNTSQYNIDSTSPLASGLTWDNNISQGTAGIAAGLLGLNAYNPTANLEVDGGASGTNTAAFEGFGYNTGTACQMVSNTCVFTGTPPGSANSTNVWGSGTTWTTNVTVGDKITFCNGVTDTVASVVSNTNLTVSGSRVVACGNTSGVGFGAYRINHPGTFIVGNNGVSTTANSTTALQVLDNAAATYLTVDTTNNKVLVGSATTDAVQVLLQLDSFSTFADTATCATTTNQGAMYYSTTTNAIRSCINGQWEDVVTTAALGLQLFGVVPDSGTTPGDWIGINGTNPSTGPCKVYMGSTTATVRWTGCTVYSGGRKIIVTAQAANQAVTTTNGNTVHVCLTGTSNQPALSTSGTENANLPTFSATAPVLCLADLKTSAAAVTAIYDTRTFTTTAKEIVNNTTATPGLGMITIQSGTAGQINTPAATAGLGSVRGIVVAATSGTQTANALNMIIATAGLAYVKSTAGTVAQDVETGATTAAYAITTATLPAPTLGYGSLGIALSAFSNTCGANADNCRGSLAVNLAVE